MSLFFKNINIFIILLLIYFHKSQCKSIILPFKKITIEFLKETKTIADFIDFNIYTNITMGTPKKKVAHFILKSNSLFYYGPFSIQFQKNDEYNKIQNEIKDSFDFYYVPINSSSLEPIEEYYCTYSDIFYLKDITEKEASYRLGFNIKPGGKNEKLYGSLDVSSKNDPYDSHNKRLFQVLKENGVIDEYYITFFYDEYNLDNNYNYLNDDYNNNLGNLILGNSPHKLYPGKYKEEDEIKINGDFSLYVNEIKFKSELSNYTESDVTINLNFKSQFIKGSLKFINELDKIFFNELKSKKICRSEIINENILIAQDIVYSCDNTDIIREKIKSFPTLYLEIKQYNLQFFFTYKELFTLYHDRFYFLIVFKDSKWELGELFLRKYITSFNHDSKTVSFYRKQVNTINQKTDPNPEQEPKNKDNNPIEPKIIDPEQPTIPKTDKIDNNKSPNSSKGFYYVIIIIAIVMGIVIVIAIITIIFFVMKRRKNRKKRADELNDEDYEYISEGINQN